MERIAASTDPHGWAAFRGSQAEEARTLETQGLLELVQRPSSVMARTPNPDDPISRWRTLDVRWPR